MRAPASVRRHRRLLVAVVVLLLAVLPTPVGADGAVTPPPKPTRMVPNVLSDRHAQEVTVEGNHFLDARGVSQIGPGVSVSSDQGCGGTPLFKAGPLLVVGMREFEVRIPDWKPPTGREKVFLCVEHLAKSVPFSYATQPAAAQQDDLDPDLGPNYGGQTLTAFATKDQPWRGRPTLYVGGVPALRTVVARGGLSLTAVTPVSPVPRATQTVEVRTPGFATVTLKDTYTYERAVSVQPRQATQGKDTRIVVTGAGFRSGTYAPPEVLHVFLEGLDSVPACENVHVLSDTKLTCTAPRTAGRDHYRVALSDHPTFGAGSPGSDAEFTTTSVFVVAPY